MAWRATEPVEWSPSLERPYLCKLQGGIITFDCVEFPFVVRGILRTRLITTIYDKVATFDLLHDLEPGDMSLHSQERSYVELTRDNAR